MPNTQENGVHLLYKSLGETPLACLERFKKDNPACADVPMTYAGRLDPMAEGLLLVLSGQAVLDKEKYLHLPKTYRVEMLWGVETDSLDILGKSKAHKVHKVESEEVREMLKKSVGKFEQKYPAYSSKPVDGEPLFSHARKGNISKVEIPSHEVEIFSAEYISRRTVSAKDLLTDIEKKISLVVGDFRQKEIIEKWKETMSKTVFDSFTIDTFRLQVSSGFYVRQFVSDFAKTFGAVATTFHIKREKVGEFELENAHLQKFSDGG